jgi:hypothetical protein
MKSLTTLEFWQTYSKLPLQIKERAKKAYRLWIQDPFHPSLHFKKVGEDLWSARITFDYRALALKQGEDYYWIWIGTHDDYESIINS